MLRTVAMFEERAMHHQVGVATNRRGEMRVMFLGEAIVPERFHRVPRALQRSQETNLERRPDGDSAEVMQQLLHFTAMTQVAARQEMTEHIFSKFLEPARVRLLVDAVNRRAPRLQ